jgi:hypothetical protein
MAEIFLDEMWCGKSDEVCFPNIQTCLAVGLFLRDAIVGVHLTRDTPEDMWNPLAAKMNELRDNQPVVDVICVGNLEEFKKHGESGSGTNKLQYPAGLLHSIRDKFGYSQKVKFFDPKLIGILVKMGILHRDAKYAKPGDSTGPTAFDEAKHERDHHWKIHVGSKQPMNVPRGTGGRHALRGGKTWNAIPKYIEHKA